MYCAATFQYHEGVLQHRCFKPYGHDDPHRCICMFRDIVSGYGPKYYDRDSKPIPMCAWAVLFEDRMDYGRVRATDVGKWWISTVWLGMDHNWNPNGPPLIFETMIFWHGEEGAEPDHDRYQARYSTEKQARRGHAQAVREYRKLVRSMPPFPT